MGTWSSPSHLGYAGQPPTEVVKSRREGVIYTTGAPGLYRPQRDGIDRGEVGALVCEERHTGIPQVWLFPGTEFPSEIDVAPYRRSWAGLFLWKSLFYPGIDCATNG